jgi:hypothetical protein
MMGTSVTDAAKTRSAEVENADAKIEREATDRRRRWIETLTERGPFFHALEVVFLSLWPNK